MKVGLYTNLNPHADKGNSITQALKSNPIVTELHQLNLSNLTISVDENGAVFKFKDKEINNENFDLIISRGGHKDVQTGIQFIEYCKMQGIKVFDNNLHKVRYLINKKADMINFAFANLPIPKTYIFRDIDQAKFSDLKFPLIVKTANSSQGKKVYKVNSLQEIENVANNINKDFSDLIIQEFIDYDFDIRLLVIGEKVIGSMQRIPQDGEFRANFSLGGSVLQFDAPEAMKELAIRTAKACELQISGVDILIDKKGKYWVLEANRTPGLAGISQALGFNVADKIIEYIFEHEGFINR